MPRWLPILCAAMLVAGCGSSSGSHTASSSESTVALARLGQVPVASGPPPSASGGDTQSFLRTVFEDADAMWHGKFRDAGLPYRPARLTIFSHRVHTACGPHTAAVGPHMKSAITSRHSSASHNGRRAPTGRTRRGELTEADLRDALGAAAVAGDDFLRGVRGGGRPPEDWTHGSSAQRQHWLRIGFTEGKPAACDTFST